MKDESTIDQLSPAARLQEMLAEAGASHTPEDIGVSRERLHSSYQKAQRIRARYTAFDLILEAGWWTQCIDNLFEKRGFGNEG